MCAIVGIFDYGGDLTDLVLAMLVLTMADALAHRGPDDRGAWTDAAAQIALGFRRLAIIDPSELGHQPMTSASGRYTIVFNGELYNFPALRTTLEQSGHEFRGASDTEVFLEAIADWGVVDALEQANGMFALAVWDRHERCLWLARDRIGEKPLYYTAIPGGPLLFASELKALRAHPAFRATIDRGAAALFLRYGYVPCPHSIYEGVRQLRPGTAARFGPGGTAPTVVEYWSPLDRAERARREPYDGTDDDLTRELDEMLRDTVASRMVADVPLGAFLSGGIDSSTVVALMQAQSMDRVRTFTIGFTDPRFDEAPEARAVAEALGTDHTELYVSPSTALEVIPRLPAMYDEPFADPSQIPTHLVARMAREQVTVALTGDGGDELFGGYGWYQRALRLPAAKWPPRVRRTAARVLLRTDEDGWNKRWRRGATWIPGLDAHRAPGRRLARLGAGLVATDPRATYWLRHAEWTASLTHGVTAPPSLLSDAVAWPDIDGADWMMYADTVTYLPDDLLVKVDRATMAVALEARLPLLDPRVVELAWRLPASRKVAGAATKLPLRRVLAQYLPPALVDRPKRGFDIPLDEWLRGPLRDWAEALLSVDQLTRDDMLIAKPVRTAWAQHCSGNRDAGPALWNVLMFQAWRESTGV